MNKTSLKSLVFSFALALSAVASHAQEFKLKVAIGDPPQDNHFIHTPVYAFEKELEAASKGRIDVQIFWNGQLGKIENLMNQIRTGLLESTVGSDGHVTPHYPDIQILGIPYLFVDRKVAWHVFDGPFGQRLADEMAAKSGIRPVAWLENGGYRHYSSKNKPLRTAADLKGLKIRTMTNPVHMEIVRSLGASPTPVPWSDLYTSLQTGVVDGQENSLSTFRIPKLEEVQKHIILDGHVYSVLAIFISEKWYQGLPPELKQAVVAAANKAKQINRAMSVNSEQADRDYLVKAGVTIVDPPIKEKNEFRRLTQGPALEFMKKQGVNAKLLDDLQAAVRQAEKELGLSGK